MTLTGQAINEKDFTKACGATGITEDDPLQIDHEVFLILDYSSKVINHSCDPNGALRNTSDLFALKDINVGEEITYDYSTSVGINDNWQMNCRCGAKNCRKRIGNVLSIPKNVLNKYKKAKGLQDFILQEIANFFDETFKSKSTSKS